MSATPTPHFLQGYWQDAFHLEDHLQTFLRMEPEVLAVEMQNSIQTLAQLGRREFDWDQATTFYRDQVGTAHLFELAAWHLKSQDYIGDTLRLIADQASGVVLDFGGGIGTHALAAALCPQVKQVIFWDLNPLHRDLVQYRAQQLGLQSKLSCPDHLSFDLKVDTIICFDVLEHLPDPSQQLLEFYQMLTTSGKLIANWYFFKGFDQEFPFHLDNLEIVETFFNTLQTHFLEVFHPFLITTRVYRKFKLIDPCINLRMPSKFPNSGGL